MLKYPHPKSLNWILISYSLFLISAVSSFNGCLYVAGGIQNDERLKSVEFYNVERDEWNDSEEMKEERDAPGMKMNKVNMSYRCIGS